MENKRIHKTKLTLKQTLIDMLNEKPFEKINVTDICTQANISRITFYSHYEDKYHLVNDIMNDYTDIAITMFQKRQTENNPNNESVRSYFNILEVILYLFELYPNFFKNITPEKNPYLALQLYNCVLKTVETHTIEESHKHTLRYSPRQITAFLCYGLAGFINESQNEGIDKETIHKQAKKLLMDTVRSQVIIK